MRKRQLALFLGGSGSFRPHFGSRGSRPPKLRFGVEERKLALAHSTCPNAGLCSRFGSRGARPVIGEVFVLPRNDVPHGRVSGRFWLAPRVSAGAHGEDSNAPRQRRRRRKPKGCAALTRDAAEGAAAAARKRVSFTGPALTRGAIQKVAATAAIATISLQVDRLRLNGEIPAYRQIAFRCRRGRGSGRILISPARERGEA